ncbi:hypothetical protein CEP54_014720 [Fusarium duplospermum]|uniref:F-box domain-containing protein n=1 Tax=Fusarium duplospermum TaxID=1325734 RepID=A0A428NUC0_9HYPO|nr:hypothetical protein CEP54_014720 [Fusarium duplospermum]
MDTLPQDIIDQIVSYLFATKFKLRKPYAHLHHHLPRAPFATVSRRLQTAVERWTFRDIRINSDELEKFIQLLTPARRTFLAGLEFIPILPPYKDTVNARAESPAERAANDESYTQAVQSLLEALKTWEEEDPQSVNYRLKLSINLPKSPSDRAWQGIFPQWNAILPKGYCIYEGRFLHSYIDLLRLEQLPEVNRVKHLVMKRPDKKRLYRNLCPKVPFMLASKMPNLESVNFSMDDSEERFHDLRVHNRQEAADSLRRLSLPHLKSASLDFWHRRYRHEEVVPPRLHRVGMPDPLSTAICDFSMNLVDLKLAGIFDASLLRPLGSVVWPELRTLRINLEPVTPSGEWYFLESFPSPDSPLGRPSSDFTHENLYEESFNFRREAAYASQPMVTTFFRGRVDEKALGPFIEAYADALSGMPKLRKAKLICNLDFEDETLSEPLSFQITYFAPGEYSKSGGVDRNYNNRQLVTSLLGWVPSPDLMAKLRGIQDEYRVEPMKEMDVGDSFEKKMEALQI